MINIINKSLCIDIGSEYVKVLQVKKRRDELIVEKFFTLKIDNEFRFNFINNMQFEKIRLKRINIGLSNFIFKYRNLKLPNMKTKDLKNFIKNNLEEDRSYNYQYSVQTNYNNLIINKFGIKKDFIDYYKKYIDDLGFKSNALGNNGYNIFKLMTWSNLINEYYRLDLVNYLVLDLGSNYLDLVYVEKKYLIDVKSFNDFKDLESVNLVDFIKIYIMNYSNIDLIILIGGLSGSKGLKNEISMSTGIQTIRLEKLGKIKFDNNFSLATYANALAASLDRGKIFYV